jgi:hypothetical protein
MRDFVKSLASMSSVPRKLVNEPRTVVTIM